MKFLDKKMGGLYPFVKANAGSVLASSKNLPSTFDSKYILTGIELELEGLPLRMLDKYLAAEYAGVPEATVAEFHKRWSICTDESLRGEYSREFVLAEPLCGALLEGAITALYSCLDAAKKMEPDKKFSSTPSYRSSTHIHCNYADLTYREWLFVLLTYALAERYIFHWYGSGRQSSNYCLPVGDSSALRALYSELLSISINEAPSAKIAGKKIGNVLKSVPKYSALNFGVKKHKPIPTFEFRHFPGCLSAEQLISYIKVCHAVIHYGVANAATHTILEYTQRLVDKPLMYLLPIVHSSCPKGEGPDTNTLGLLAHSGADTVSSIILPAKVSPVSLFTEMQ